jgi:acetyl esterase
MKKLSPAEEKFKAYLFANHIQPFSAVTAEAIAKEKALFEEWAGDAVLPHIEMHIKARDHFPVRVRIFNPEARGKTVFYFPGNGYAASHMLEVNSVVASRIAKASNLRVIFVDFRLMPTFPWPTPVQDAHDIISACVNDYAIPDLDPHQIVLAGWSGGAHTSVMLALDHMRGFAIQQLFLIGGPYDFTFSQNAYAEDEALDYICIRKNLYDLPKFWGIADKDLRQPEYSPLFAKDFKGFPETYIMVGEFDGVRSDSEALYTKLLQQGVSVKKTILPGQTHNNIGFNKICGDEHDAAVLCARYLNMK